MFIFLSTVHVIACLIMIIFILLQDPKGDGGGALGMMGGGSSKSLFGHTGGNQFLVMVTKVSAVIFAFTSVYLAALSTHKSESVMDKYITTDTSKKNIAPAKMKSSDKTPKTKPTPPAKVKSSEKSN